MVSFIAVNKFILSDIRIHIPEGLSVGVIGKTGSGKTTLLKLICGLLEPEEGEVYTMGMEPVAKQRQLAKSIGALFSHLPLLKPEESIVSNLENRSISFGMAREEYEKELESLVRIFDLSDMLEKKVEDLSLGQRKRAELAAVFLTKPKLLLLDEPTIGLDQKGKDAFRNLVSNRRENGLTTIMTSHDMSDISASCSRIVILREGTICAYGKREQLLKKYAPMDVMEINLEKDFPDLLDLPIQSYYIEGNRLTLIYNSNHVTSAEILRTILQKISVKGVSIRKPNLEDVMFTMEKERG